MLNFKKYNVNNNICHENETKTLVTKCLLLMATVEIIKSIFKLNKSVNVVNICL